MAKNSTSHTLQVKSRFCSSNSKKSAPVSLGTRHLTSFTLFSSLHQEIRDQIWKLALPDPRVLHVHGATKDAGPDSEYKTSIYSYGGAHPSILSVNRDSRSEALRHLTPKFKAYWNLEIDYLYIDVKRWGKDDSQNQLADMTRRGLLDDIKHLALDSAIWQARSTDEYWTSLSLLGNVKICTFIFSIRDWHKDVLTPSQSWYLQPIESGLKPENHTHESWCLAVQQFGQQIRTDHSMHAVLHKKEWQNRSPELDITVSVIEGRKMERLPWCARSYYKPHADDWFG